jgi:predicted CoA-binding protein
MPRPLSAPNQQQRAWRERGQCWTGAACHAPTRMIDSMKTVAVIGASPDRRKYGNKALRAFRQAGYRVIPINPHHAVVEGEPAYGSVLEYPGEIDLATVYVPPHVGKLVIESLARKGIGDVWFNPGADTPEVLTEARALGIRPIQACSIRGIGMSPGDF